VLALEVLVARRPAVDLVRAVRGLISSFHQPTHTRDVCSSLHSRGINVSESDVVVVLEGMLSDGDLIKDREGSLTKSGTWRFE
jgi:hypothetical protein